MKKMLSNWRYYLLGAIAALALINLIGLPGPNAQNYWLIMLYSKFTAVVLFLIDVALFSLFSSKGQIDDIKEYLNEE